MRNPRLLAALNRLWTQTFSSRTQQDGEEEAGEAQDSEVTLRVGGLEATLKAGGHEEISREEGPEAILKEGNHEVNLKGESLGVNLKVVDHGEVLIVEGGPTVTLDVIGPLTLKMRAISQHCPLLPSEKWETTRFGLCIDCLPICTHLPTV